MKSGRVFRQARLAGLVGAAVVLVVGAVSGVAGLAGAGTTASARGGAPGAAAAADQNVITTLDPATATSIQATIGSDGLPVIAYLTGPVQADGTPIDPRTLKLAHCSNVQCTSATIKTLAANAGQQAGFGPGGFGHTVIGLAIGTDGFPLVTYYKWDTKDLAVVHCSDVTCATRATRVIASTGDVGRDSSLTTGPAIHPRPGQPELPVIPAGPVIAYYDATGGTLKVTRCTDPACAGTKTTKTLDTTGNQGALTSVATSVDGTPVIAYRAAASGPQWDLRTVYCTTDILTATSKFCNKAVKTTVAAVPFSEGDFFATSIVIGSDGLPLIGYGGRAHCSDVQCTTATITPWGSFSNGQVPFAESVAVGADHLPMFAGGFPAGPAPARFAHCVAIQCPDAVVAPVTVAGWGYPSVTLGSDGLPFLAFAGGLQAGDGLSAEHCANEFCSTLFRRR